MLPPHRPPLANRSPHRSRNTSAARSLIAIASLLLASLLIAAPPQPRDPKDRPKPTEPKFGAPPDAKSDAKSDTGSSRRTEASPRVIIDEKLAALEDDLAQRMIKRSASTGAALQRLELEIDLRLLARQALLNGKSGSEDAMASGWLRHLMLAEAIGVIETAVNRLGAAPMNRDQQEWTATLHQLTFSGGEGPVNLDDACKKVAAAIIVLSPQGAVDTKSLPVMRPATRPSKTTQPAKAAPALTIDQLIDEVSKMQLAPPLKQQTLELGRMAVAAKSIAKPAESEPQHASVAPQSNDPLHVARDRDGILKIFEQVVDLERGLQSNTAVSAESRPQLEKTLAESIALYLDPRTRRSGQLRVESFQNYRMLIARIRKMNLSSNQTAMLAPLFAWAEQNPDGASRVLSATEKYLKCQARFDALPRPTATTGALRKSVEEVVKQYEPTAAGFASAVAELTKPNSTMAAGDLDKVAEELLRQIDLLEKLEQLPRAIEAVFAYKPRPFGALEKRLQTVTAASSPIAGQARTDAVKLIDEVVQMAAVANDVAAVKTLGVPLDIEKLYAGGQLAQLDLHWKALMGEVVSGVAGGAPLDHKKLNRVALAKDLVLALQEAATVEGIAANYGMLNRWVDWKLSQDELRSLFAPYAKAMTDAYTAYMADAADTADKWKQAQKRYRPIMILAADVVSYRDECAAFPPSGLPALVGALLTPMDEKAPFATQRYASLMMAARAHFLANQDPDAANEIAAALSRRIAKDLKLDKPDKPDKPEKTEKSND